MRHLLRRVLAIILILSVVPSMLGLAHVPCAAMAVVPAPALAAERHHAMGHRPAHDGAGHTDGGDHGHRGSTGHPEHSEHGGTTACPLVIHCGTMLPAVLADAPLDVAPAHARQRPTNERGSLELGTAPDSPPPRA